MASGSLGFDKPASLLRGVRVYAGQGRVRFSHTAKEELDKSSRVVEQVIRPTGFSIRGLREAHKGQIEDLYGEIRKTHRHGRTNLVKTLQKRWQKTSPIT
jgi:excinuclease UvrABC helicase subunit UvrB